MTNTITSVVDTYIASWNEGDAERRRALVAETFDRRRAATSTR